MGKFVFFAVLFAALVAVSVAQGVSEQSFTDTRCRREVQAKPLQACRQILHQQLTGGGARGEGVRALEFRRQWDVRERCCRQVQSVSPECRCSAIRGMVRDYEQAMPAPGQGHCGGDSGRVQQGQQAGQGYYGGEIGERQPEQGGGYYYGERPQHGEWSSYRAGAQEKEQQIGRVKLTKARQYVAGLPTLCQIEPMECSVFSADQY